MDISGNQNREYEVKVTLPNKMGTSIFLAIGPLLLPSFSKI